MIQILPIIARYRERINAGEVTQDTEIQSIRNLCPLTLTQLAMAALKLCPIIPLFLPLCLSHQSRVQYKIQDY